MPGCDEEQSLEHEILGVLNQIRTTASEVILYALLVRLITCCCTLSASYICDYLTEHPCPHALETIKRSSRCCHCGILLCTAAAAWLKT